MNKTILYGKTRTGKTKVWSAWVVKNGESGYTEIHYEWGMTDGKKQLTIDLVKKGVNEGKANATTPLEQALLTIERKAKKKQEEGYIENLDSVDDQEQSIDFNVPFSKYLCFYKPKNSIDDKKLIKLEANRQAVFTVKRDGMMHIVRKSKKFGVEIYSRRMDLVTEKYPHLSKEFMKLPDGTILLGEIILLDKKRKDNFRAVSSICRSDPEKAIARQDELGKVTYYIFDVAFWNGKNMLTSEKYMDRRDIMLKYMAANSITQSKYIDAAEIINKPHAAALKNVQKRGLEGLVVWDADGKMDDGQAFTFNGKAYRPNVLWKSKPKYEDDFIVRFDPENDIGSYGKGKNSNKLKSVCCYQLDDDGNEVYLGLCGGGLSDDQRSYYTNDASYPRVWRIEYDSIQPETGKLRFPVFNADRTTADDKQIEECLMSDAIKQARQEKDDE